MFNFKYFILFAYFLILILPASFCSNFFSNDMVLIPSGKYKPLFKYGDYSSGEEVYVESFMLNKYPVSNFEFENFLLLNSNWSVENISSIFADSNYLTFFKNRNVSSIDDYPVVYVSWFAADAFCSYIGGRLPTLDEWEYVASVGINTLDGKTESEYFSNMLDWYISSQSKNLLALSDMKQNYFGVFGLHGVIWEWVSDFNSVILLNTDAEGGGLEEVLYCGATATNAIDPSDYVSFMRFAFRNTLEANYTSSSLGFRCAKNIN